MSFWEISISIVAIMAALLLGRAFGSAVNMPIHFLLMAHRPGKLETLSGKIIDRETMKRNPGSSLIGVVLVIIISILVWRLVYNYRAPMGWWFFGSYVFGFIVSMRQNVTNVNEHLEVLLANRETYEIEEEEVNWEDEDWTDIEDVEPTEEELKAFEKIKPDAAALEKWQKKLDEYKNKKN